MRGLCHNILLNSHLNNMRHFSEIIKSYEQLARSEVKLKNKPTVLTVTYCSIATIYF